jgi:hypothetical protein
MAATALQQQAALVLADQPQHVTLARFKALTDTMAALRRLFGGVLGTAYAEVRCGGVAAVMCFCWCWLVDAAVAWSEERQSVKGRRPPHSLYTGFAVAWTCRSVCDTYSTLLALLQTVTIVL